MRACELLLRRPLDAVPASATATEIHVFSIPRGCQIEGGRIIWPDGREADAEPFTPFTPTEPLSAQPNRREPAPSPESLEVVEPSDDRKVIALRPYAGDEPGAA